MNEIKNLVSIIIPCYNQGRYLKDSLSSVANQTYTNWECIIVNDGSTDNTHEVALKWLEIDKRFIYINSEHGGPSVSRNIALKRAKGEYIQFLDSDDWLKPQKIERQLSILSKLNQNSLSICDYFVSQEDNLKKPHPSRYISPKFKTTDYLKELISEWEINLSIPILCILFKRKMYINNYIFFDESLPNHVDWDFWMKIFSLKPEVNFINEKLVTYRIQPNSITHNQDLMRKGYLLALKKQKKSFIGDPHYFKLISARYNKNKYGVNNSNSFYSILLFYRNKIKKLIKIINSKIKRVNHYHNFI